MNISHTFHPEEGETSGLPYSRPPLFSLRQPKITAAEIIAEVADRNGLTVAELKAHTRARRITGPRQEAMYELRRRTTLSLVQIARRLGLKDHATVLYGIQVHERRLAASVEKARAA